MDFYGFGLGFVFIVLGFLIKKFPNLMAGYNTMSAKEKANVDTEGLTTFARNSMIIIGLILIVTFYGLKVLGYVEYFSYVNPTVIVAGVVFLIVGAQKFDKN